MGLDRKDIEMMAASIPTVDWLDIRDDIDRLTDAVNRLEQVVEMLVLLHREERVATWQTILESMLKKADQKGIVHGNRTGSR